MRIYKVLGRGPALVSAIEVMKKPDFPLLFIAKNEDREGLLP